MAVDKTLFDRLGGQQTLRNVHKILYDKIYAHPRLSKYFCDIPKELQESQQTDFMEILMGGSKGYAGKAPRSAHQHMVISEELFDIRSRLLSDSINEASICDELKEEWLAIDARFKRVIVKSSEEECTRAYSTQPILDFTK